MRKNSAGRSLSANPIRTSVYDREERSAGPSDVRRTLISKSKGSSQMENSQIPRPRMRSTSSERYSVHRKSNLKISAKTPLVQANFSAPRTSNVTPITPKANAARPYVVPPSASRHKSPAAERASCFAAKGPRKDSRPINEKFFQSSMLNKIDNYFMAIDQSALLNTNGSLKPVTLKMFIETSACLLSLLDVKHNVTTNNYTDELPKIAKKLRYPGTVAKSWLKTANTMHSWPQVLAWLSWLVEVCEAKDVAERAFEIDKLPFYGKDQRDEDKNRKIFLTMFKCYAAWNEENPEEEAAYIEQLVQDLNGEHSDIDSELAAALANLEKERACYEAKERETSEIEERLSATKREMEALAQEDLRDSAYLESLRNKIQSDLREMKYLEADAGSTDEKTRKDEIEYQELLRSVENQSMTVEERDRINEQCSQLEHHIEQYEKHIQDIEKDLFTLDLKFSTANQSLYSAILAYNKDIITNLGPDIGVDLEVLKLPEDNMLSADFMEQLQEKVNAMSTVHERIIKCLSETNALIEQKSNELESLEERLRILREENKIRMEKMAERKIGAREIQRKADETEAKLKEQMKTVETEIQQLEVSMPDVDSAMEELKEARDKYDAVLRRQTFLERSAVRFFDKFYAMLAKHRNSIADLLNKIPKSGKVETLKNGE